MTQGLPRHAIAVMTAGSLILFLSIGARQGFGLFFIPLSADLGLTREAFARAVALQYLMFGLVGPMAGLLAERFSASAVLLGAGVLYALGFAASGLAGSELTLLLTAGLLIGVGLGGAHFGVVNAAVLSEVPAERRGVALGTVAAVTAFGQLVLLFFTQATIDAWGWRSAMQAHAALVLLIVPLALLIGRCKKTGSGSGAEPGDVRGTAGLLHALKSRSFWLLSAGFAFSGFQVMFTMTHLPALVADLKLPPGYAVASLGALSASSFVGSWYFGRLSDCLPARWILIFIYLARAAMAAVAWRIQFTPDSLIVYFAVLGLVWMCTMPVTSHLTAQMFGVGTMASVYGAVFLSHQVGGFAGTWLGGVVFDRTGSYDAMWASIVVLCTLGAVLTAMLRPETQAQVPPHSDSPASAARGQSI